MTQMMEYSETIPIQYQEGRARFMGMDLSVDPRVLIPRPETELLVQVAADLCRKKAMSNPFILDIGTGSGNIALGLVKLIKDCYVIGTDISSDVLAVARKNVRHFRRADKVQFIVSDMFAAFAGKMQHGLFDCIVSNPPYVSEKDYNTLDAWVKAEPRKALYAGPGGLDYLDIIAEESSNFLSPNGFIAVEIGYDQADKVKKLFSACGFSNVVSFRDFNNYERVVAACC